MLSFRRVMRVPQLDASREAHFLLHSGARAYVVRASGVSVEKRLFHSTRLVQSHGERHALQVILSGRMRLAHGGRERWLERGDVSLQAWGFPDERWEGERFEAIALEWMPSWSEARLEEWTIGALPPRELERLAAWGRVVVEHDLSPERAAAHFAELLVLLSSAGLPIRRAAAPELIDPLTPAARHLAAALSASLADLSQRPMLVDLEGTLGRSARHLRRGLGELNQLYSLPGGSWQKLLHWWRLTMASTLMTAPGATTEQVSAVLGYGSPRAFCLAMAQAGLPSPGRIARIVRELR